VQIAYIVCPEHIEEKLLSKHSVTVTRQGRRWLIVLEFDSLKKDTQKAKMFMQRLVRLLEEGI
jgi:hypothetical protein